MYPNFKENSIFWKADHNLRALALKNERLYQCLLVYTDHQLLLSIERELSRKSLIQGMLPYEARETGGWIQLTKRRKQTAGGWLNYRRKAKALGVLYRFFFLAPKRHLYNSLAFGVLLRLSVGRWNSWSQSAWGLTITSTSEARFRSLFQVWPGSRSIAFVLVAAALEANCISRNS